MQRRIRAGATWLPPPHTGAPYECNIEARVLQENRNRCRASPAFLAAGGPQRVCQSARPADRQPDVSASRPHRQGRLRGIAEGHEGHRHRGHRAVQPGLRGVHDPRRRQADQEDPRRQRHEVPQRALHDALAAQGSGRADRVGAGARHDHDEHGEPRRPRHQRHDDARGSEARRRRIQQDRGRREEGRPAADRCTTRASRTPGSKTAGSPTPCSWSTSIPIW